MLVNFNSSEYIFRVLGTTKERGFYSNSDDLREIVENKFVNTVSLLSFIEALHTNDAKKIIK